jgi:hypothetical protein
MPEEVSSSEEAIRSGQTEKMRDRWDYIELFLRPVSAFLTAVTIALIGWFGQGVAFKIQEEETIRSETVQNYRLYTELLSKREDAESALRRDMFTTILEKFFQVGGPKDGEADMDKQLLKLEMLALNFGESLSLSPLFIATDHAIDKFSNATGLDKARGRKYRKRLHSLAKRVADQQLSALSAGGEMKEFNVPLKFIREDGIYTYPDDDPGEEEFVRKLEEINRAYSFTFSQPDEKYKSVQVEIEIQEESEPLPSPIERKFDLNFFNFPMVDNTRLSSDQRFALILTNFGDKALKVTAISFPGKYSGQRDKPFLDDVIHRLQKSSRDTDADEEKAVLQAVGTGSKKERMESE